MAQQVKVLTVLAEDPGSSIPSIYRVIQVQPQAIRLPLLASANTRHAPIHFKYFKEELCVILFSDAELSNTQKD